MRITWKNRLEQRPSLRSFERWPAIPLDSLPRKRRKAFLRNQRILAEVLCGDKKLKKIARQHNVSIGFVSQLLNRCLGGEEDKEPALTIGLVPYQTLVNKQRKKSLPTLQKKCGGACAFKELLKEVPGLREGLDEMIQAKLKDAPYAQRLTPQAFHGEFKRILSESHWPRDRYPFTTESLAYASVRRYLKKRIDELQKERQQRRLSPPRKLTHSKRIYRAMRATQIDEHILNLRGSVHLELNDELIPLPIARANVLVPVDVDTTCILGYLLAPTRHPNQQDMLTLFDNCLQPWQPLELMTPGLSYAPGASFPNGLDDAFPISFGTVHMDNALMHRANSVIDLICENLGATLDLGLPAMPIIRELVESIFDYISEHLSNRVASTTGSHPKDPIKESRKNQKKVPLITFQILIEALSIILTEYNITPRADLGYASPLELYQHHCTNHFVRYVPHFISEQWQPFIGSMELPLHWYKHENRLPFVNFYYARYQGPGLLQAAGEHIRIRVLFDRRDIRTLQAYTLSGEYLGVLHAPLSWQRFPHSLSTRQWIHKNVKRYRLNMRDPLSSYFRYLLDNKGHPNTALSLLRVYNEFTAETDGGLILRDSNTPPTNATSPTIENHHIWHPDMANHRE